MPVETLPGVQKFPPHVPLPICQLVQLCIGHSTISFTLGQLGIW